MKPARILWPTICATALLGCGFDGAQAEERADIFVVQRNDLSIRVTETAEVQPLETTRIKNEMEGQSTIIYLIEEGLVVEKGEKLVELDASALEERLAQQGITLHRAQAAMIGAEKELKIRQNELEAEKLGGQNAVRIAEIDLEKFLGKLKYADVDDSEEDRLLSISRREILSGELRTGEDGELVEDEHRDMGERLQQLIDAQANIKLAEQEVKLAKNKEEWSRRLQAKNFITKDDLERDELDHQRALKNLRVRKNELDILIEFTHPKEMIRLEQGIREAETNLLSIEARGQARIAQAEADLEAKKKEYELAKERYENLEHQIENAVIRAPTPGLVVYASEGGGRRYSQEFVEEGATVRERQNLIQLPDVTHMIAELKVHEASVDKVRAGQRALIKVDAFSDREFTGIVKRVSPVADSGSRWSNNNLKVYKTTVEIEGENRVLRPGMSASVTIIVAHLEDVLFVPLQAIRRQGAVTYVWLDTAEGPFPRRVELGLNDFQFVVVTDGLAEADRVYLADPPEAIEPEFEQPAEATLAAAPADAAAANGPGDHVDGARHASEQVGPRSGEQRGDRGREGRGGGLREIRDQMQKVLDRKYPELSQLVQEDPRAWFTNEELRETVQKDEELRALSERMMQQFRGRGGGRAPGETAAAGVEASGAAAASVVAASAVAGNADAGPTAATVAKAAMTSAADEGAITAVEPESGGIIAQLDEIERHYHMGENVVRALDGVTLEIRRGEYLAIMGRSGSGKSTMLNILGCLDRPTAGRYLLGGEDVASLSDDRLSEIRGQRIGFIFQSFNLIPQLTVLENLEVPLLYQDRSRARRITDPQGRGAGRAASASRGGSITGPAELSGGQQQRVAIARALDERPAVPPRRRGHRQPRQQDRGGDPRSFWGSSRAKA